MSSIGPLALALIAAPVVATAGDASWDVNGNLQLESRWFIQDAAWPGQSSQEASLSLAGRAEVHWRSADERQRMSLVPYVRWDESDDQRSLADLREAYWACQGDDYEILVGANTVFWGVTESEHLVDIINQTDAAGDIDGEEKLGQPMANLALQRRWGAVNLYVMPWFRERTFPGVTGRLRAPIPVDRDGATYTSSAGRDHVDAALRYSHYIGDIDIGLSLFSGTSREPRWLAADDGRSLLPVYDVIEQAGVDLQYTRNAWLWKFEGIVRDGISQTFGAAVGGFEYTVYQIGGSDADVGLLLEYQYDGRNAFEPVSINDNDVFVGTRLAWNDVQDSTLLAGLSYDLASGEVLVNVEAERRFGQDWVLKFKARMFSGAGPGDITYPLARDDYVQFLVARYF
jgi:hypothetical protein